MKSRSIFSKILLAATLSLSLDAPHARADEPAQDEPAPTSITAGIALPESEPKPRRVTDKAVVDMLSGQLKKLAANAAIPLGAPEVLTWSGPGYTRENAKAVAEKVTASLKDGGFDYRTMGKPVPAEGSLTTVFTANSDAKKKMLMGYWVESEQMLVLVWGALEEPDADAFPGAPEGKPEAPAKPQAPAE